METILNGKVVSVLATTSDASPASVFESIKNLHRWAKFNLEQFELIIISDPSLIIDNIQKDDLVKELEGVIWLNLGKLSTREIQLTAALDACIGDVLIEFRAGIDELVTLHELKSIWETKPHDGVLVCKRSKNGILHKVLSRIAGFQILSSNLNPRIMTQEALHSWSTRQDRSTIVRLAHHLSGHEITYFSYHLNVTESSQRNVRETVRSVLQISPNPLRWASLLGITGSLFSLIWAFAVLIIGISSQAVEGWTTTNFQISILFFLLSLVLSILAEYVYQISSNTGRSTPYRIRSEIVSPVFPIRGAANVEVVNFSYTDGE
jgi:hypothetical protein